MKKFKAVIFDMDGTLVPIDPEAAPSTRVVNAIRAAHAHAYIGVATGRSRTYALPVMKALYITNVSVLFGGAQIVDPITEKVLWDKQLEVTHLQAISKIFDNYKVAASRVFFGDVGGIQLLDHVPTDKPNHGMSLIELSAEHEAEIFNAINGIDGVTGHIIESWHGDYEIIVSHQEADKEHGLKRLLKMQGLNKEEVIVVGDSANDLPLFLAGGFRVAMGNATDELKALADYIAPSIEEDGAAHVIEKFILPDSAEN